MTCRFLGCTRPNTPNTYSIRLIDMVGEGSKIVYQSSCCRDQAIKLAVEQERGNPGGLIDPVADDNHDMFDLTGDDTLSVYFCSAHNCFHAYNPVCQE